MSIPSPIALKQMHDKRRETKPKEEKVDKKTISSRAKSTKRTFKPKKDAEWSKKPFVRPDHLTQRPLADSEDLKALKNSLIASEKPRRGGNSRTPRTVPRPSSARARNSKKENN